MTDTPPGMASSWVDLSREIVAAGYVSPISPRRLTPAVPFGSDNDYMRMLRQGAKRIDSCLRCLFVISFYTTVSTGYFVQSFYIINKLTSEQLSHVANYFVLSHFCVPDLFSISNRISVVSVAFR